MNEVLVTGRTLPEAYHTAIAALAEQGEILSASDWNQSQKEISATFVALEPLHEPMVSKLYIGGFRELQQYMMEILDGILDFKVGDGWDYTYHDRMANFPLYTMETMVENEASTGRLIAQPFNQIDFVIQELKRQPDSRRAVIAVRDNSADPFSSDPACLQHIQFMIRNQRLHAKVLMRSNDATKAAFMNAFAFVMLQKRIADTLQVEVGSYTHRANSFHAYERDYKLLKQYAEAIKTRPGDELCYAYEPDFKELMEESIPAILEMVDGLRSEK